jgi:hypothetical protein
MQRLRGTRKNRCAGPIFLFGNFSGEARIGMRDLPARILTKLQERQKRKIVGDNRSA